MSPSVLSEMQLLLPRRLVLRNFSLRSYFSYIETYFSYIASVGKATFKLLSRARYTGITSLLISRWLCVLAGCWITVLSHVTVCDQHRFADFCPKLHELVIKLPSLKTSTFLKAKEDRLCEKCTGFLHCREY